MVGFFFLPGPFKHRCFSVLAETISQDYLLDASCGWQGLSLWPRGGKQARVVIEPHRAALALRPSGGMRIGYRRPIITEPERRFDGG